MNILVLGAGHIGRPMAIDLANDMDFQVAVADINKNNLDKIPDSFSIRKIQMDFSDHKELHSLLRDYDIILSAVPSFMGYDTLKEIIKAGKNVVDIAFFSENPFDLDELAKKNNLTAVVDCGVAPGMSNILTGYVNNILDSTETILIYVGGLPIVRDWPYEYKAGFSPADVIEEYTRPARYVEDGRLIIRPALSDPEFIDFPGIGTLEAFNSDGLRTLAQTLKVPNMKEKTLRFPGHIEKMLQLRETGFFSKDEIEINGTLIRPLDFTSKLLFPLWELKDGDLDFTVMRIIIEGSLDNKKTRYTYSLHDQFDVKSRVHSMARTTGYTATAVIRLLAENKFNKKGICPPEFIGQNAECVEFVLKKLEARGIFYQEKIEYL